MEYIRGRVSQLASFDDFDFIEVPQDFEYLRARGECEVEGDLVNENSVYNCLRGRVTLDTLS